MPSWATHFRIADRLLGSLNSIDTEYFIIGNISPDCGIPAGNGYDPPTPVTHFTPKDIFMKSDCDYNFIYEQYIKNENDIKKKSFFTGYYVHLFTDCRNAVFCYKAYGSFLNNPALSAAVRKEWQNLDFEYFKNNVSPSFELFKTYKGFSENYPEWYKNNEIAKQMKNIVRYYSKGKPVKMNYAYSSQEERSRFVEKTAEELETNLKELQLI